MSLLSRIWETWSQRSSNFIYIIITKINPFKDFVFLSVSFRFTNHSFLDINQFINTTELNLKQ